MLVHPNQILLPSLEEVAKKLTLLISTKEDWYYAFVRVNEDTLHLPLSNARHISILVDRSPSRSTHGHLSQLEVHWLLYLGGVAIYPEGLNGGLDPVWVILPKLPLSEVDYTSKDTQLQITLPRTTQGDSLGAVPLWSLTPVSFLHSITECSSEVVTGPSMMEEVEEPLLNPLFKMPVESSTHNSPRRQPLVDLPNPMATKEENPLIQPPARRRRTPILGEALLGYLKKPPQSPHGSSQVDPANITAHSSHSLSCNILERDTSPTPLPSSAHSVNLLDNAQHLQEEMNDTLVHLLSARAAIDTCCQWIISETEVSHCQNEIDTSKAIREIKAWYATMIADAKATYRTIMRKAEAAHLVSTSEAEITQATGIRKVEATNATQASKLQQQHQEDMQNLEVEALKVEKDAHQSFLWAYGVAFQACPSEALAKLMYPLHLLTGSLALPGPLMVTLPLTTSLRNPFPPTHCPSRPTAAVPSPRAKWHQSPDWEAEADHPGEPAPQRWREEDPLLGHLMDSHHEVFHKDLELVQCIRQTYFRTHALTFHKEDTNELADVFKELAEMAGLLGTEVYLVHDQWAGKKELHSTYHGVRGSARDLHFFRTVSPLESPKIMGLQGIHSPEALKW